MRDLGSGTGTSESGGGFTSSRGGKLQELWLKSEPTALIFFTTKSVDVRLHFEESKESSLRGFVRCLKPLEDSKEFCPYCSASGGDPEIHLLISVYSGNGRKIKILRVKDSDHPGALLAQLEETLPKIDREKQMLVITYEDREHYVKVRDRPSSEFGKTVINAFLREHKADNKERWSKELEKVLNDVYPLHTMDFLRQELTWVREDFPKDEFDIDAEEEISMAGSGKDDDEESI